MLAVELYLEFNKYPKKIKKGKKKENLSLISDLVVLELFDSLASARSLTKFDYRTIFESLSREIFNFIENKFIALKPSIC